MKRIILGTFALVGILFIFTFQNCSKVDFKGVDSPGVSAVSGVPVPAPVCTLSQTLQAQPTKVILLVDQSSSNNTEGLKQADGTPRDSSFSTDPKRMFRESALSGLTTLNTPSSTLQYSISSFWSTSKMVKINDWTKGFIDDPSVISTTISDFASKTTPCALQKSNMADYSLSDCGGTPYLEALQSARAQIQADDGFRYVIILISDGVPSGMSSTSTTSQADVQSQVIAEIANLSAVKPGKVFLNTVYYYHVTPDPNAVQFVQKMAEAGSGSSVSVDSSGSIDLGAQLKIITQTCN
jgi:hypothetical protein